MMIKLRVTAKKLNRRTFIPNSLPEPRGIRDIVNRDFTFHGEKIPLSEVPNGDLGIWYKDENGLFYWGGGVNEVAEVSGALDYRKVITNAPSEWTNTNGRNVKVAILDTGFFLDHPDLLHLKPNCVIKDCGENTDANDRAGHGTHILGFLGALSSGAAGITGLIPEASFFLYKVIRDDVGFLDQFVETAILDAIEKKVDIINMSFNVPSAENSSLHKALNKAIAQDILLVASAGENDNLIQNNLVFPAQFSNVISIGEATHEFAQALHVGFNNQLDLIMPFADQRSCWINDSFGLYRNLKGSSMACAQVTGVLASAMSFGEKKSDSLSALKKAAIQFTHSVFSDSSIKIIKP